MSNISHSENIFLSLLVAACTTVSYLAYLSWWRMVPRLFYPEERRLKKQIEELRAEAERCNNTEMLHHRGKLCRQAQQLTMELTRVRRSRISFCRNSSSNVSGKDEGPLLFLHVNLARLKYALPRLVGFFISFGFMIPVMYLYGSRPDVVVFPHCFRIDFLFRTTLVEPLIMLLLLCPLPWGSFGVNAMRKNAGEWMHTQQRDHNEVENMRSDHGSAAVSAFSPTAAGQVANGENELGGELHKLGVFSWFLACYITVRLTHRVFASRLKSKI